MEYHMVILKKCIVSYGATCIVSYGATCMSLTEKNKKQKKIRVYNSFYTKIQFK